jgi:drug/metabolite transporter (DMT)-like permease
MMWMALSCVFGAAFGHVIRNAQARGRNMAWVGAWNYILGALAYGVWWAMQPAGRLSGNAVFFGLLTGVFYGVGYLIMHACIRAAGVGITTTVNRLAIAVPISASIFVWGEQPGRVQIAGVALALIAFPFLAYGRALPEEAEHPLGTSAPARRRVGLLGLSFLAQGVATVSMKNYSRGALADAELVPFLCFVFVASGVTNLAAATLERPRLPDFWHGLALGATNVLSTFWFMRALDNLPATDVFLTTSVGTILLSAGGAVFLWRERYRGVTLVGLVLAAIALVLVNLNKL